MSIGTTITAPSPARTAFPPARGSPLNPSSTRPQSTTTVVRPTTTTTTRTHLSNLDRLLLKQQQSPPQPPAPQQANRDPTESSSDLTSPTSSSKDRGVKRRVNGGATGNNLFNALNLTTILPWNPTTESMSPKTFTRIQRLLESPRPSPKNPIASRWRLYHGSQDWAHLLDPLDENLRRELVRYGELVQAAYHAFHSNPAAQPTHSRHVILPDRSYRVTKSLYATSSVDLPKWLDGVAPWMTQRSSWIGYVAVCDNLREINRMGRRDIVISLRGTSTCMEWAENLRTGLVPMENTDTNNQAETADDHVPKVANGFYSLFKTPGQHVPSLSESVVAEVRRLMEKYKGEELSITVTGHSLGAALALFVADELSTQLPHAPPVAVFSFGGPRAGNQAFADRIGKNGVKVLRVVNADDVVTRVPGVIPREELRRRLPEKWGSHVLEESGTYVHVGGELRVDTKSSPYLRPNADPSCSHDLESYLHLVDGFIGSDCPFRADAKRSLVGLLDQQRPNVKRLYVSQAKALGLDRIASAEWDRFDGSEWKRAGLASPHMNGCLASPSA